MSPRNTLQFSDRAATLNLSRRARYLGRRCIDRRSASYSWATRASRLTGRPADITTTKECACNYVNRGMLLIYLLSPPWSLSVSNVPRCARSIESVYAARARVHLFVACVHLVNCSAPVNGARSALRCSSTANSSERITEPSRTSSASRTAVAAPKNSTAVTMCPM